MFTDKFSLSDQWNTYSGGGVFWTDLFSILHFLSGADLFVLFRSLQLQYMLKTLILGYLIQFEDPGLISAYTFFFFFF